MQGKGGAWGDYILEVMFKKKKEKKKTIVKASMFMSKKQDYTNIRRCMFCIGVVVLQMESKQDDVVRE